MIWNACTFLKHTYKTDELGNKIPDGVEDILDSYCRAKPWTLEEIQLYGELTKVQNQYIVPLVETSITDADLFELGNRVYEIVSVQKLAPRYSVVTVKAYRVGGDG